MCGNNQHNFESRHPGMILANFGFNWPSGSIGKEILVLTQCDLILCKTMFNCGGHLGCLALSSDINFENLSSKEKFY